MDIDGGAVPIEADIVYIGNGHIIEGESAIGSHRKQSTLITTIVDRASIAFNRDGSYDVIRNRIAVPKDSLVLGQDDGVFFVVAGDALGIALLDIVDGRGNRSTQPAVVTYPDFGGFGRLQRQQQEERSQNNQFAEWTCVENNPESVARTIIK
ncbi:MAG: hypothetical protein OXE46_02900 [Chloroflexi bacterium]|nr:hypothetical protein [Chloroflexota bacterium]